TVDMSELVLDLVDEGGIHRVHESSVDVARRMADDAGDGEGDHQADDRIGELPTQGGADRTDDDRERRHAVGARVQAVGDERGGPDPPTDADAVARDELVPGEADDAGGDDEADVV